MTTVDFDFLFRKTPRTASAVAVGDVSISVASLPDIIKSKRAAGRPRDVAVLELLERAYEETTRAKRAAEGSEGGK